MANSTYVNIPRASLLKHHPGPQGSLITSEFVFEVPLDYAQPKYGTIHLSATMVHAVRADGAEADGEYPRDAKPIFVFLCGGPGCANDAFRIPALNRALLTGIFIPDTQFQILYLDYRGTGGSTPVEASTLSKLGHAREQARYLKLFRQDNIVRDLEAVRKCLSSWLLDNEDQPWTIMGQSYGGWIALTYLSFCRRGLKEVFLTGALAPVGQKPDSVYLETYNQVRAQNIKFYQDSLNNRRVYTIAQYLISKGNNIPLPSGGKLTVQRFMLLGRSFGSTTGIAETTQLLKDMMAEITSGKGLTNFTLGRIDRTVKFGDRPLYAVLHEAIYCDRPGIASNWAAQRVGEKHPRSTGTEYAWLWRPAVSALVDKMYFAGEMIYPFHFDTFAELAPFKDVAEQLARCDDWPDLYDRTALALNTVPVSAVGYSNDMYVSARWGKETASIVRGLNYFESPNLAHDAIRTNTDTVLGYLAQLRRGVVVNGP